jgi:hypothetical protein
VAAWKLAEAGCSVLVLEAGPFYGNEQWPKPHEEPGGAASSGPADLSGDLLDEQFTRREFGMVTKLLFGPADHERGFWFRKFPGDGAILQCAGVGGTTLHYLGNHPRAYPASIDEQGHWPIDYADLVPYYREVEDLCEVAPAPTTAKDELFFRGAEEAGWDLIEDRNVTEPGYRPQPNAIKQPDEKLHVDADYDGDFTYPEVEGDTPALGTIVGNPHPRGAPFEEKAKQASNVSFVPAAMKTGPIDHGIWAPLRWMFPNFPMPVLPVGISGLGPRSHHRMGQAIRETAELSPKPIAVLVSANLTYRPDLLRWDRSDLPPEGRVVDQAILTGLQEGDWQAYEELDPRTMKTARPEAGERLLAVLRGLAGSLRGDLRYYGPALGAYGQALVHFEPARREAA